MFKYNFIVNSEELTPETYHFEYENEQMKTAVVATCGFDMTVDYVKKLAEDGQDLIDLCGDFDGEKAKNLAEATGVRATYAKYTAEEMKKLEACDNLSEYGVVTVMRGVTETIEKKLISDEFNTTIIIVGNEDDAAAAAIKLVDNGISFIELCSYFTEERANKIIEAIGGRVPVGYCG